MKVLHNQKGISTTKNLSLNNRLDSTKTNMYKIPSLEGLIND